MSEEEITRATDEIIQKFQNNERLKDWGGMDYYIAIDCAILYVEAEIEAIKEHYLLLYRSRIDFDATRKSTEFIEQKRAILTELKSRL